MRVVDRAAQREEVIPLRDRAGDPDEQQRHLPGGPGQTAPELDAGRVGPVQVVDHQRHRPGGGFVDDQRDELLGEQRGYVGAAVGGDLAPEEPRDRGSPGVRRRRPDPERVEERVQRQLLAELVAGPPENLAAPLRPVVGARTRPVRGGRERGADQGGFSDSGLALNEHGVAAAPGEISQQPVEQRKLVSTSSQHAGRDYRRHEIKRTGH